VKVHFADLKRSLFGTGKYELFGHFKRHAVTHQCWFPKTAEQKDSLFRKLLTDRKTTPCLVQSKCGKFEVPRHQTLAKKKEEKMNAIDLEPKGLKKDFEI